MSGVQVVTFNPRYRGEFARLNYAWITQLFVVEPPDRRILDNPETEIIAPGGQIFFALDGDRVLGTVALKIEGRDTLELTKMAVAEEARGKGVGRALLDAALAYAKQHGARKIVLSSHTKLAPAIGLYRAAGFVERKDQASCYSRCNIYMERFL